MFPNPLNALPQGKLPDPFLGPGGRRIRSPEEWPAQRKYLKEMLAHYLYGFMPEEAGPVTGGVAKSEPLYGGQAVRETALLRCGPGGEIQFELILTRPKTGPKVPFFVWNNFADMSPCPVEEEAIRMGYGIAVFNREQLAPDTEGAEALGGPYVKAYPGRDWRALAIWAWGMSRAADYLLQSGLADPERLIATGFSRGGKAALCAAIYDERFAVCAAASSGCGGAGNFRHLGSRLGPGTGTCESLGDITLKSRFWYWFADAAAEFGNHGEPSALGKEALLPFDLHFVRAAIAPRALITTEGLDDAWSNPFGSQLSWYAARPVYEFLGIPERNALRFREGGHAYNAEDWRGVLRYCEMIFGRESGGEVSPCWDREPLTLKEYFDWEKPLLA